MEEQIVNISINKQLWKEVGVRAILEGVNKKDIVNKALIEYLKKEMKDNVGNNIK